VIRGLGYGVVVAEDGATGLEMARRHRPELVLTDALLPKMDGREMCRLIKEDPSCGGTKVVVMTALYTSLRYEREAYKAFKVDGYVAKPLAIDDLDALLKKELRPCVAG
jgi:CheY-like chemotaxis protein